MRVFCTLLALATAVAVSSAHSQSPQARLAAEHSELTSACKRVRGHAQRIAEEASQTSLNRDIARAHAAEVSASLRTMEQLLRSSRKLLSPEQSRLVAREYAGLDSTCASLQTLIGEIEKELDKDEPNEARVRKWANDLRRQMTEGYQLHTQVKQKLNIR